MSLIMIRQFRKHLNLELSAQWIDLSQRDGSSKWSSLLSTEERAKRNLFQILLLIKVLLSPKLDWMSQSRGITQVWWLREPWDSLERLSKAGCVYIPHHDWKRSWFFHIKLSKVRFFYTILYDFIRFLYEKKKKTWVFCIKKSIHFSWFLYKKMYTTLVVLFLILQYEKQPHLQA